MKDKLARSKGPLFHRVLVFLFSILLGILIYWLLGFVMRDIGTWPGPKHAEVEAGILDQQLVSQRGELATQIEEVKRSMDVEKRRQDVLEESTRSSERSMNQLLEIHRLALQQEVTPSPQEQEALAKSEQLFLANQERYQEINNKISQLTERLHVLETELRQVNKALDAQRGPVQEAYAALLKQHNFRLAAIKLAVLVPLLLVAVWLALKKRAGLYGPLIYAFMIAVLSKVFVVMHQHFHPRYFKYILILTVLALVVVILIYLLRMVAFPKRDWLLKQYRESYESFFCPVCSFPIRRGPMRYLFWSRRSLKKMALPQETSGGTDEPYICPMCGTGLFEECESCHAIRHSLLPVCSKCGKEKQVSQVAP